MKIKSLVISSFLTIVIAGCSGKSGKGIADSGRQINLAIENGWTNEIPWVQLRWHGRDVPCGVLSPETRCMTIGVEWPKLLEAEITLTDDLKQAHVIKTNFTQINDSVVSGRVREVTIRIVSLDRIEISGE